MNEDAGAQTVSGWATAISDGDGNTQTLTFNVTNNTNPSLFSAGPAISAAGVLTYTPAADANGTATITMTLSDDGGTANGGIDTSAAQMFTITVNSVNDAPSFTKGPDQTVLEDSGPQMVNPWATAISAGPTDEAGQTLTFNITSNTNTGLFSAGPTISATGELTYTPTASASGSAIITLTLSDNGGTANGGVDISAPPQTFTITVSMVDDPPVAVDDGATVAEEAAATTIDVLANDMDSDAGPISIGSATQPANGTVMNNGMDLTYQPNANYCNDGTPTDDFTYTLTPGGSTATVRVTVTCLNDPPVVDLDGPADDPGGDVDFAVTFTEGTPVVIVDTANLTVSDPDSPDLASATVTITNLLDAGIETLAATTTGTAITANYVAPTLTLSGSDTLANYQQVLRTVTYNNTSLSPNTTARIITFVVNDGTDASATATTTLSITSVNSPPTVTPATFTLDENSTNGTAVGTVTATDPDLPAQTLTYAITAGNTGSAFAINSSTGQITVATSTALDFEATPTFSLTVQVTDNGTPAQSGSATITVNLTNVNDPPVVMAATFSVAENSANGTTVGTR